MIPPVQLPRQQPTLPLGPAPGRPEIRGDETDVELAIHITSDDLADLLTNHIETAGDAPGLGKPIEQDVQPSQP